MANAQTKAVRMAQTDMESVIKSFKDQGHFMDKSVSPETQARRDRIAQSSPEIRALLNQGLTQDLVDRLARLSEGD